MAPGDEVIIDTLDGTDAQITPDSVSQDLTALDPARYRPLTGPIAVTGAAPGDVLVVDVLDCEPARFGHTALSKGIGLLGNQPEFTDPFLALWRLGEDHANSADLPGVKIAPRPLLGAALLAPARPGRSSADGDDRHPHRAEARTSRDHTPPSNNARSTTTVMSPQPRGTGPLAYATVGTRLLLPVSTSEALLSLGDSHYAQGEGMPGAGIAMGATWRLRLDLRKNEATIRGQHHPHFEQGPQQAELSRNRPRASGLELVGGLTDSGHVFATTGICVVTDATEFDATIACAAREALLEMIEYLRDEHRYSAQQAYALCGAAVHLRVDAASQAATVHTPVTVTALLPTDIFEHAR